MRSWHKALLMVTCIGATGLGWQPAQAQTKVEIINDVGAKGPCLGIGLGMALVPKCVARAVKEGFLRESDVGIDGLTIGTTGSDDGTVTEVAPGSAAAAGMQKGDRIKSVDGKSAIWTPAMEVARQSFGESGTDITLTIKASESPAHPERQVTYTRGQAAMPAHAPSGSIFIPLMPLVDWRGTFIPCTSAGPLTVVTFAVCEKLFKPWAYIKAKDSGTVGFTVDPARTENAVVQSVEANSPAAKAGLSPGDVIVSIDGKPLAASNGELARTELFGAAGATRVVVAERSGQQTAFKIVLGKKPE
jgi:S1-C subfamily serine protease